MDKVVMYEVRHWTDREAIPIGECPYREVNEDAYATAARARQSTCGFAYSFKRKRHCIWLYLALADGEAVHVFIFSVLFTATRRGPTSYGVMRRYNEDMAYLFHDKPPADRYIVAANEARVVAHEFYVRSGCLAHCG